MPQNSSVAEHLFRRNSRRLSFGRCTVAQIIVSIGLSSAAWADSDGPWRLSESIGAPDDLTLSGSYRVRYESLDGTFRSGSGGSDQILVERLLLGAEYDFGSIYIGGELQDSRAQLTDSGSPLGTDDVNAFELLRAYIGYRTSDAFVSGDKLDLAAGRITIDAGSRRLVARNRYRNTLNSFTGVQALWTGSSGDQVQAFFTFPVDRRPNDIASLEDNEVHFDEENPHVRFWGVHYTYPDLIGKTMGEFYLFGLNEDDRAEVATRNRNLYTPGFRLLKAPAPGKFDYEIETALQFGQSRAATSATAPELDHFAHFHHAELGYTLDNAWKTRFALQYDFASGDGDPADGDNQRFDTLYGARRFDFGPTGIYGAFARSNINSPGIQVEAKPAKGLDGFISYRAVFLASERDALTTAGVQDASGASGSFAGNQIEARIRYDLVPGNIKLEGGAAYLIDGKFLKNAPNAARDGDTAYFYSQVTFSF